MNPVRPGLQGEGRRTTDLALHIAVFNDIYVTTMATSSFKQQIKIYNVRCPSYLCDSKGPSKLL